MTEQEKREKAIKELHSILLSDACSKKYGYDVCPRSTCSECAAMIIYDHCILPKEKEVQKELFYKIYHKIEDYMTCCISRYEEINAIEVDKILRTCAIELGFEVEE